MARTLNDRPLPKMAMTLRVHAAHAIACFRATDVATYEPHIPSKSDRGCRQRTQATAETQGDTSNLVFQGRLEHCSIWALLEPEFGANRRADTVIDVS
eukprot:2566204-Amphidinium_carterae.1